MSDESTTLATLKSEFADFVRERDWEQFHSPKNLSMSLAIEAGELMEHFQWLDVESSRAASPEKLQMIGEELADVFCYTLAIANSLDLDLAAAFRDKMQKNATKYPAEEFKGRSGQT